MTTIDLMPKHLLQRLDRLRRRLRVWFLIDGLGRLMAAGVVWMLVSLLIDHTFRMDRPQRGLMLMIFLAACAVITFRRIVIPLRHRLTPDSLALRVERANPQLGDGLISALQLARIDADATGASPGLIRAAIEQGVQRAQPIDFAGVLDRHRRNVNLRIVGLAAGLILLMVIVIPTTMSIWAQRNLMLANIAWPRDTRLVIEGLVDGELIATRGDNLILRVTAEGEVPDIVYIDHRPMDVARRRTEQMINVGADGYRIEFRNVLEPFRFRVRGGDGETPEYRLRLVDRPTLRQLALTVSPPPYTGREPYALPADQSVHDVLSGSTLHIDALGATDLKAMTLLYAGQSIGPLDADADNPRRFSRTLAADELKTGGFGIVLTDPNDLTTRRPIPFHLRVRDDQPPGVHARLVGIGDLITANALLPLNIRANDDFSVESFALTYVVNRLDSDLPPQTVRFDITAVDVTLSQPEIEPFGYTGDVSQWGVRVGSHLSIVIEAADNHAIGPANVGKSSTFSMKVVTEQELIGELLRREQEQRVLFERLVKDQQNLAVETEALHAEIAGSDRLTPDQFARISSLEKQQRLIAGRCEGIASRFEQIEMEVRNNRLEDPDGPTQQRLRQRIVTPLRFTAVELVPAAVVPLDLARKSTVEPEHRRRLVTETVEAQRLIVDQMNAVLRNMVKMESYQEAIRLIREVQQAQKQLHEKTTESYEESIGDIFDDE